MATLTASQVARIRKLNAAGIGATTIAAKLQLSFTAIRRVLDRGPDEAKDHPALRLKPGPVRARRHVARIDGPSPVDVHVGRQVRLHRTVAGLSQSQLGGAIGLTFQQVQKYERGSNRMSAGVLVRIAGALGVPPTAFFLGLYGESDAGERDVQFRREAIELARAYERIRDPDLRQALRDIINRVGAAT